MRKSNLAAALAVLSAAVAAVTTFAACTLWRRLDPRLGPRGMFGRLAAITLPDEQGTPVRLLFVGRSVQSATYLGERRYDLPLEYYRAFDRVVRAAGLAERPARLLVLGGGGYAYPKHAVATMPAAALDVVELDPAVTDFARRHFYLADLESELDTARTNRLRIVTADALDYLRSVPAEKCYDAVVMDAFEAGAPAEGLSGDDAIAAARGCLVPGGVLLGNVVCPEGDPSAALELADRMASRFARAWVVPCTDESFSDDDNYVVVASDREFDVPGAVAQVATGE